MPNGSPDQTSTIQPAQQAGKMLAHVAGFIAVRTMQLGMDTGLIEKLGSHPEGLTSDQLADSAKTDPLYTEVWCNAAYGAEIIDLTADRRWTMAPHIETVLLNQDSPGYVGGVARIFDNPEMFTDFGKRLKTGERMWWDECSPEFILSVSKTSRPFYTRAIPGGLSSIPGLADRLNSGAKVVELACGTGHGMTRLLSQFPATEVVGIDGDQFSLDLAAESLKSAGLSDRGSLRKSTLEEFEAEAEFDLAFINVSMHECRDIDRVTRNVLAALKPGGVFVISDFAFPEGLDGLRSVPGRVMSGVQFFEAQIDDQLLPTQAYVDLLNKHGFRDVDSFDMGPIHGITYGMK